MVFIVASWAVGSLGLLRLAGEAEDRLDRRNQEHIGQLLLNLTDHELDEMGGDTSNGLNVRVDQETSGALQDRYRYQIWSTSGKLLLRSANHIPKRIKCLLINGCLDLKKSVESLLHLFIMENLFACIYTLFI